MDATTVFADFTDGLKTQPYDHQRIAFDADGKIMPAQMGEMGTGKSWILMVEAALKFQRGMIDRVLIVAPKGVAVNWVKKELPKHCPVPYVAELWRARKKELNMEWIIGGDPPLEVPEDDEEWEPPVVGLRILVMNWGALRTKRGLVFAKRFLEATESDCLCMCDEVHRVKNPKSKTAKGLMALKPLIRFRRIASGTPVLNSPFDLFLPYKFLSPKILGGSYVAFKAEYAQLIKKGDPLYHAMLSKLATPLQRKLEASGLPSAVAKQRAEAKAKNRMPTIVAKDSLGRPMYKNLDRLQEKIRPFTYRPMLEECVDMPGDIQLTQYFELTPKQRAIYKIAEEKLRLILDDDTVQILTKLTAAVKLGQITSGFYINTADRETMRIDGPNPKLLLMEQILDDTHEQAIIWATRKQELADLAALCKRVGKTFCEYHGRIGERAREEGEEAFHKGDAQIFIGHPTSGGIGLTLNEARLTFYYSNTYSLGDRKQSEKRNYRLGQAKKVCYTDLVGQDTIEEKIITALQNKSDLAELITGDL